MNVVRQRGTTDHVPDHVGSETWYGRPLKGADQTTFTDLVGEPVRNRPRSGNWSAWIETRPDGALYVEQLAGEIVTTWDEAVPWEAPQ